MFSRTELESFSRDVDRAGQLVAKSNVKLIKIHQICWLTTSRIVCISMHRHLMVLALAALVGVRAWVKGTNVRG